MDPRLPVHILENQEVSLLLPLPKNYYRTFVTPPRLNKCLWPGPSQNPIPRQDKDPTGAWRGGRERLAAQGPGPQMALCPGRRPQVAPAPRGRWARHAHAAGADTATRAGRWEPRGRGGGSWTLRAPVRSARARRRPLRFRGGGARLARPPLGLVPLTTVQLVSIPEAPSPAHTPAYLRG